jgi:hypothetical protein
MDETDSIHQQDEDVLCLDFSDEALEAAGSDEAGLMETDSPTYLNSISLCCAC